MRRPRPGTALGARWADIKFDRKVWEIRVTKRARGNPEAPGRLFQERRLQDRLYWPGAAWGKLTQVEPVVYGTACRVARWYIRPQHTRAEA